MAGCTGKGPEVEELRERSFASTERQLFLETVPESCQLQPILALAWIILSAAYSEENDATINIPDPKRPLLDIVFIRLHFGAEQSIKDLQGEFQRRLHEGVSEGNTETLMATQEDLEKRSNLPKTLVALQMDDEVQALFLRSEHVLVITCRASISDVRSCVLKGHYDSSRFDERDCQNLLDRIGNLMTQFRASEDQKVGDLNMMSASDKQQLRLWNDFMPPSVDACVQDLIELQSKRHPSNEAVCAWDGSFTYEELNRRATLLAKRLVLLGVSVGTYVPLMFEKSKWHIISLLAVLKAGAAFIALEHSMPDGRIQMILEQLGSLRLILTSSSQSTRIERLAELVIIVDEIATSDEVPNISLPVPGTKTGPRPNDPAYVIFTSGSTGTPKGAIIEHRQLCTSMQALNERLAFTPDMRKLQMTAFNFDLSLSEIFCPLLAGGCVCMPSEWTRFNDLAGAVTSLNANFGSFSPSFFATLSEEDFPTMKTILLAGERVPAELSSFWTRHGRRMVHMYGPTECTVGCCFLEANTQGHHDGFIGDAYASKLWIVDTENKEKLMPIGAPGELVVEGPIVGRSYLANPEMTQASFIECPSWFQTIVGRKSSRFYKTGDVGRLRKDGTYEIIGRKDTQTKIRGLRVEIQEIEHRIREACESKIGVAVEVRNPQSVPGQEMLVAFLETDEQENSQSNSGMGISSEDISSGETAFSRMVEKIRTTLPKNLPGYMIPSAYLPIGSLPFSNSYKLDRRALKERANSLTLTDLQKTTSSKESKHQERPLTEKEAKLRSLWAGLLHTAPETVGIQHDFFHAGGDSLKAMALVSAARRSGMYFSVAELYQLRNIAELAKLAGEEAIEYSQIPSFSLIEVAEIRHIQAMAAQQCGVKVELIQDVLPVFDMQGFYLDHQRRRPCSWQIPLAIDLPLGVDSGRLQRAWEQLLAHFPITRTRFIDTSFGTFQVVLKQEAIHWRFEGSLTELLAAWETEDMSFGHKTHQSALLKANDQSPARLMWYVNHAIVDQIMNEHLAQELSTLYEGEAVSLPKRRPFKSVVEHRLNSNKLGSQTFWRSHLSGAKYKNMFKTAGNTKSLARSKISCQASIKSPEWLKTSEYSISVTAWAIAFTRFAGIRDIPFFMIRAGRDSMLSGSEDVIGPLLTRAPLRVCVERDAPIVDLLRRVNCDIEESRKHEIVRENDFQSVSEEAAAHLAYGISINFIPPSSGLTLSSDALFPVPEDVRDGLDHKTQPFTLSGELHQGSIKMDVTWDEDSILRQSIEGLLNEFQAILRNIEHVSLDMTVDDFMSV